MFSLLSLSFLSPWLGAALPLFAGSLLFLYGSRRITKAYTVPATFLLRSFKGPISGRRGGALPRRAIFDLFVLLLLGLAAMSPAWNVEDAHIRIFIDTSPSMLAQSEGRTLLEIANERAQEIAGRAGLGVSVSIEPLQRADRGKNGQGGELVSIGEEIEAVFRRDIPLRELGELLARSSAAKTYLITDRNLTVARASSPGGATPESSLSRDSGRVEIVTVGGELRRENVGIVGLERVGDSVEVSLINSSSRPAEAFIAIEGGSKRVAVILEPNAAKEVSLKIPERGSETSREIPIKVAIEEVQREGRRFDDALSFDNGAWTNRASGDGIRRLLVVSREPRSRRVTSLEALPGYDVQVFDRAQPLPNETGEGEILLSDGISHGDDSALTAQVVERVGVPSIRIESPSSFEDGMPPQVPHGWREEHPLLRYIDPSRLAFAPHVGLILTSAEAQRDLVIMDGRGGPLIVADEQENVRHARYGFDLLPYEGDRERVRSILLLNALRWVGGSLREGSSSRVLSLGEISSHGITEEGLDEMLRRGPGLYPVDGQLRGVNFFSHGESDTASTNGAEIVLPQGIEGGETLPDDLTSWFLILLLLITIGDSLVAAGMMLLSFGRSSLGAHSAAVRSGIVRRGG